MSADHHSTKDAGLGSLLASVAAKGPRILVASLVAAGLALAFAAAATPRYKGTARLLIEAREPDFTRPGFDALNPHPISDEDGVRSQMDVVGSTDILKQAARKLDITQLPEFGNFAGAPVFDRLLVMAGLLSDPAQIPSDERVLNAIREKLNVFRAENSRVIAIEYSSGDRKLAAELPNALAETYIAVQRGEAAFRNGRSHLPVDARFFSRATVPAEPYFPKTLPIVGTAFCASLLVMAIITLARELLAKPAMRPATDARPEPIAEVPMPAAVPANQDVQGWQRPVAKDTAVDTAAGRLAKGGAEIFISSEDNEDAATAVVAVREAANSGLRVVLIDLTSAGVASRHMLDSNSCPGITDLLASEAQFSDVIHADRYSGCHVIPHGIGDPERATRAADRLPIVLNSLMTAYDIVVVECGPAAGEGIRQLVSVLEENAPAPEERWLTGERAAAEDPPRFLTRPVISRRICPRPDPHHGLAVAS